MDGFAVSGHASFFERFAEGGVGVAGTRNVLAGCAVFERENRFCDHLAGVLVIVGIC